MSEGRVFRPAFELPPHRSRIDREIDEELRLHIDERTAELIATGLDPATARVRALERFGDLVAARDEIRGIDATSTASRRWREHLFEVWSDLRGAGRVGSW